MQEEQVQLLRVEVHQTFKRFSSFQLAAVEVQVLEPLQRLGQTEQPVVLLVQILVVLQTFP
jgi:hypothetical protein